MNIYYLIPWLIFFLSHCGLGPALNVDCNWQGELHLLELSKMLVKAACPASGS